MKRELHFYLIMGAIFIFTLFARAMNFGIEGLFVEQPVSFGSFLDTGFADTKAHYMWFSHLVNPYGLIISVAVLSQAFVMSLSACLVYLYPALRDVQSRAHLQGQDLVKWYKDHGVNPLVIMITPFIRLAVLIAVMLVFIRPMSSDIEFPYGVTELFVLSALYFPAVIPHLLVSKLPFWEDTNFIVHLLVGVICLFVAPYPVFVYFTCTAVFHAGKVVAIHLMEFTHEEKSNFTR